MNEGTLIEHQPTFTVDWFSWNIPLLDKLFEPFKGQPNLRFLEIGVFEGRSTLWLLENVLTHPTSRTICVDPFETVETGPELDPESHPVYHRFRHNIAPYSEKVEIRRGFSQKILRELEFNSFDMIYIDGSHHIWDVLDDAVLSARLLKIGGVMIFDDYGWGMCRGTSNHPKEAVDCFMKVYEEKFSHIYTGYQVYLMKTGNIDACPQRES